MPGAYRPDGSGVTEGQGSAQGGGKYIAPTNNGTGLPAPLNTNAPSAASGLDSGVTHTNSWGQTQQQVMAMQTFLKNRGFYDGAIDGIRGNGTNAAISAFGNRNTHSKVQIGAPAATVGTAGATATTPAINASTPAVAPGIAALPQIPILSAQQYAQGATNAAYNPQIAALAAQISGAKGQGVQDQKDLQNWYNQLQTLASQTGADTASSDQAAQSGYDAASNNSLAQLFGGGTAPNSSTAEAQTFHDINAGNLASNNQADQNFNNRAKLVLQATGQENAQNQLNKDNAGVQGLVSSQVALQGAKGQAYDANYQTGLSNEQQQIAAQQAQQLAQAMAGPQIAGATANATAAIANAQTAPAIAQANLALVNAKVKAATAAAGANGWNLTVPAQRGALTAAFKTSIMGPNQGLKVDPNTTWNNVQQSLTQAGLAGNSDAQALAKSVFLEGLHNSHAGHNFGGWAWNGKKVVPTGNSYNSKGQLVNKAGKVIPNYVPKG